MSDQEASVSVSSTKRCPPSRCMYQYRRRRRSTSAQEASVSSTKRCPPSRCISTAVVTYRSTTKHMLGRRYHSPGRTYITCWAVIPFTAAESIGHMACGRCALCSKQIGASKNSSTGLDDLVSSSGLHSPNCWQSHCLCHHPSDN